MPSINVSLLNEYRNAYGLTLKKNYSEPKTYDANGNLNRRWYIRFLFRNSKTGLLEKQTPIYGGANKFKTKRERYEVLNSYRKTLVQLLEKGLSPCQDNSLTETSFSQAPSIEATPIVEEPKTSIREAFAVGLATKELILSKT